MVLRVQTTVIIPASGQSARFGAGNKLLSELAGKPLVQHVIDTVADVGFCRKIAVIPHSDKTLWALFQDAGFDCINNASPDYGMGYSLALGAKACLTDRAVVMLADMPLIPPAHIQALIEALGDDPVVFTQCGDAVHPPAALGPVGLAALRGRGGDQGLRGWTSTAKTLSLAPGLGQDIDTPDDLAAIEGNWDALTSLRLAVDAARK